MSKCKVKIKGVKEEIAQSRSKTASKREGSGKYQMGTRELYHSLWTKEAAGFGFLVFWFCFFVFVPPSPPVLLQFLLLCGVFLHSGGGCKSTRLWVPRDL